MLFTMAFVIYVCDTETTGLDSNTNEIVEISFWRLSDDEHKTWLLKALRPDTISEQALKKNGHKLEDVLCKSDFGKENYKEPTEVLKEIESWIMMDDSGIDSRVFVGQNPQFDLGFMKKLWENCKSSETFPFGDFVLDTIQIAKFIDLCTGRRRKFYNLSQLVKDFSVTKGKAHRAAEDTRMTKDLFLKQFEPVKTIIADIFKNSYSE